MWLPHAAAMVNAAGAGETKRAALAEVTLAVCCHRAGRLRETARAARTKVRDAREQLRATLAR